jgi:hypothetical protein
MESTRFLLSMTRGTFTRTIESPRAFGLRTRRWKVDVDLVSVCCLPTFPCCKIVLTFRWLFSVTAEQQEEQEDDENQDEEIEVVEEEEDDYSPSPQTAPQALPPPPLASTRINMAPSTAATTSAAVGKGISWIPIHEKHAYRLNGYDRMMYIIDMSASFSGKPGSYKLLLRENGFDLSIPAPPPLTDPHHVHSYLTDVSGRIFSDDSCKKNNWLEHVSSLRAKSNDSSKVMWLFRETTPFKIEKKVASDLPHKGKMFAQLKWADKKTGDASFAKVLILELKGTERIELESEEEEELTMGTFQSPQKVVGADGELAQMARAFEKMLAANPGRTLDDVLKGAANTKRGPGEDQSMDVDGVNKRSKEAGAKCTGLPDADADGY